MIFWNTEFHHPANVELKWIKTAKVVPKWPHLASCLLPCEQRLHFRGMSWRAKSSLCRQPFSFLSCMRKIRHAIRKQLVRKIMDNRKTG